MRYTRFEKTRIISARTLQIVMGAPILIKAVDGMTALDVAKLEFEQDVLPITVRRPEMG
ncbi:MAG: DNA-directed RNA polymerase subunit K [Candidatus Aenigmatarchaeota archaeon]